MTKTIKAVGLSSSFLRVACHIHIARHWHCSPKEFLIALFILRILATLASASRSMDPSGDRLYDLEVSTMSHPARISPINLKGFFELNLLVLISYRYPPTGTWYQ